MNEREFYLLFEALASSTTPDYTIILLGIKEWGDFLYKAGYSGFGDALEIPHHSVVAKHICNAIRASFNEVVLPVV